MTALNLTNFAADGPLPADHIPKNRKFIASQLSPFATNMQIQGTLIVGLLPPFANVTFPLVLSCASRPDEQIRLIINDGVTPLTGISGCPPDRDGMCPVPAFVNAQQSLIDEADWEWDCYGDWKVDPGKAWNTTTGRPPPRPKGAVVNVEKHKTT